MTLLPDLEISTVEAWLRNHPTINILWRDGGGGYGEAGAKALPNAIQVADRWHLMENDSRECQESCVRDRVIHHASKNLSSKMMAKWVFAALHSRGGFFHSFAA